MEVSMLALGWRPAVAKVVAKRFVQENVGAFNEYVLDVLPAEGEPPFRTTLKQMAFFLGEPDVGDVVPAFCKAEKQAVKYDVARLQAAETAKRDAKPAAWDAVSHAAPGTPTGDSSTDATRANLPQPRIVSAAELLATGQRMTGVLRQFSSTGKTAGEANPAAANPDDPLYAMTLELPLEGAMPIVAAFVTRVPAGKTVQLALGKRMNVAVNPGNPTREVAIDWDTSPTSP